MILFLEKLREVCFQAIGSETILQSISIPGDSSHDLSIPQLEVT